MFIIKRDNNGGTFMNLPNKLTITRIIMVPIFVVAMAYSANSMTMKIIALSIFILANLTDILDGYIARSQNIVTDFGKFIDPIADKLLIASGLICLVGLGNLDAWIAVLIIGRDFIISGIRLVASNKGVIIGAIKLGKAKTVSQAIMISLLIFNFPKLLILNKIIIIICIVLTIVSLLEHLKMNKDILKTIIQDK